MAVGGASTLALALGYWLGSERELTFAFAVGAMLLGASILLGVLLLTGPRSLFAGSADAKAEQDGKAE